LKYYNDNKGHQAGDHLLQKAAGSFLAVTDHKTRIFRTGGDEFIGIVTSCAESDVDDVIAKWQGKLAELNSANDGIHCTIAWGAAYGAEGYRYEDVLALADERMYAEKRRMKELGLKQGEVR
jgi:diguanylate cyclase (GGDEF)-like protein